MHACLRSRFLREDRRLANSDYARRIHRLYGGGTANDSVPLGSLTLAGTTLYGTTLGGGTSDLGTVFSVGTDGTDFQNLFSFTGGTASGLEPACNLTLSGTTLYGTIAGGANDYGAIFSVGTDGTSYHNVVSFTGSSGTANGNGPGTSLTLSGTTFYGMTGGGEYGYGNVFSVGLDGTNYQSLISFTGAGGTANGRAPMGGVTLAGAALYGMTYDGGIPNINGTGAGNVFNVGVAGSNYQNLISFTGSAGTASGAQPFGSLTLGGAALYGMTRSGGADNMGNIFSVGVGGNYQNLLSFTGTGGAANGQYPDGSLVLSGTSLYGVTYQGGAYGYGNIFSVGIDGSGYQNLYSFTGGTDGAYPEGDLTLSGGTLFGTTSVGGIAQGYDGQGTVFALGLPPSAVAPPISTWNQSGGGSWSTSGNWTPAVVPNGPGWEAVLGSALTVSSTITLDGNQTVGLLVFNNSGAGYTLAAGSGGTLTLDYASNPAGSQLLVLAGSHSITAPVTIAGGSLTITESNNSSLLIAGNINDDNGSESLTLSGDGTGELVLCGTNTYGGGTNVEAGTLVVANPAALPPGGSLTVGAEALSIFATDETLSHAADAAAAVPEPSTLVLLGLSTIALMRRSWLVLEWRAALGPRMGPRFFNRENLCVLCGERKKKRSHPTSMAIRGQLHDFRCASACVFSAACRHLRSHRQKAYPMSDSRFTASYGTVARRARACKRPSRPGRASAARDTRGQRPSKRCSARS